MACDVLAKTVSAVCHSKPSFGWVHFHVRLSTCLNDFHSGLLSKGPEESADGDHDHHLRHHHRHNIHHYHWLWSSGQVGTVSHPKVQTLSNRTPDAQPAIAMEGGAADRNHSGEGQGDHRGEGGATATQWGGAGGNPHHREPQGGGGIPWGGGGEGGPSSSAPYIRLLGYFDPQGLRVLQGFRVLV